MLHEQRRFPVSKIADSLDTTVASVNDALQRASGQLAAAGWRGPERAALLARLLPEIKWPEIGIYDVSSAATRRQA
jgi:hypothetical protein